MIGGRFTCLAPGIGAAKDKYLSPAEYSPSTSTSKMEKDELLAYVGAMKFASLFCCGSG
jgi:hypothetical protein